MVLSWIGVAGRDCLAASKYVFCVRTIVLYWRILRNLKVSVLGCIWAASGEWIPGAINRRQVSVLRVVRHRVYQARWIAVMEPRQLDTDGGNGSNRSLPMFGVRFDGEVLDGGGGAVVILGFTDASYSDGAGEFLAQQSPPWASAHANMASGMLAQPRMLDMSTSGCLTLMM